MINWDIEKDFDKTVRSILVCNKCGWCITNPREEDSNICDNCRVSYLTTKSKIKTIKKEQSNG